MKKKYIEPMMIVEDFTVSEMVAKNCKVIENDLKIVTQLSGSNGPCDGYLEDPEKQQYYPLFSDLFGSDLDPNSDDSDTKDGITGNDFYFSPSVMDNYKGHGSTDMCTIMTDALFNADFQGFTCTSDTTLLQNS